MISAGEMAAGTPLPELALAAQLGVSRTPVREAIGHLVAEGVLQKSSRGTVVAELTRQDIVDLYEVREALEVYIIGKVAERGLPEHDRKVLRRLVEEVCGSAAELEASGKAVLLGAPLKRLLDCDLRFHFHLLQAGGNQRMMKLLDSAKLLLLIFGLRRERHTLAVVKAVHDFHRRILAAVLGGKREEAMELIGRHIRLSRDERLAEFQESLRPGLPFS
jgi:DNA-binding GntR family transcriptional regulator